MKYATMIRLLVIGTAALSLSGCSATAAFLSVGHEGFYSDHKHGGVHSPVHNTNGACTVHGNCGGVRMCDLYGNC